MQKVLRKFTKLISEMVVGVERLVFPKEYYYYFGKRNNVTLREQKKQLSILQKLRIEPSLKIPESKSIFESQKPAYTAKVEQTESIS